MKAPLLLALLIPMMSFAQRSQVDSVSIYQSPQDSRSQSPVIIISSVDSSALNKSLDSLNIPKDSSGLKSITSADSVSFRQSARKLYAKSGLKNSLSVDSASLRKILKQISPQSEIKRLSSSAISEFIGAKNILRKRKIPFNGMVSLQSQYIYTPNAPSAGSGLYTSFGINLRSELFKIPLNVGLQLTMHDKQVRTDYISFNVGFDANSYKDKLKTDYLSKISSLPSYFGNEIGTQLKHFEDSLKDYEKYKNTLSSPDYYSQLTKYSSQLKTVQDSLSKDSTNSSFRQDYQYLSDTIGKLKAIAQKYSDMETYRRQYPEYTQKLDRYHQYVDRVKATPDITTMPGIQDSLRHFGLLTKVNKFLSGIQSFALGRVALNLSHYTVQGQSIYGFQFDYLWPKKIYTGIGAGFAAPYSFQFAPTTFFSDNPLSRFDFHRIMMYARLGYGPLKGDHIHLIWMSYMDRFAPPPASIISPITPPANSVLAIEGQQKLNAVFMLMGEVAVSNSSFTRRTASFVPFDMHTLSLAAQLSIRGTITKTNTNFGLKGEVITRGFTSAGNIFQRRDLAGYTVDLRQMIFRSRLSFSVILAHNFQGFDGHSQRLQYLTMSDALSLHLRFAAYTLSYMLADQAPYGGTTSSFSTISHSVSLQQQYPYQAGQMRFLTGITSTWYQSEFGGGELGGHRTFALQNSLQQDMTFPRGTVWRIGAGSTYTRRITDGPAAAGYWAETGHTITVKKTLAINYMLRYTHDGLIADNIRGSAGMAVTIYKGLRLDMRGSLTWGLGNSMYSNYSTVNAAAGLNYSW